MHPTPSLLAARVASMECQEQLAKGVAVIQPHFPVMYCSGRLSGWTGGDGWQHM
jgi:hypothetical protein